MRLIAIETLCRAVDPPLSPPSVRAMIDNDLIDGVVVEGKNWRAGYQRSIKQLQKIVKRQRAMARREPVQAVAVDVSEGRESESA